jgi:hypothetical protein
MSDFDTGVVESSALPAWQRRRGVRPSIPSCGWRRNFLPSSDFSSIQVEDTAAIVSLIQMPRFGRRSPAWDVTTTSPLWSVEGVDRLNQSNSVTVVLRRTALDSAQVIDRERVVFTLVSTEMEVGPRATLFPQGALFVQTDGAGVFDSITCSCATLFRNQQLQLQCTVSLSKLNVGPAITIPILVQVSILAWRDATVDVQGLVDAIGS